MAKLFTITISLLAFCVSTAQTYDYYYYSCNLADKLYYLGDYKSALDTLQQAFSSVDYVHSSNLIDAYNCAIKMNDYEKAFLYGKKAMINSGEIHFVRHTASKEFKKSTWFKVLQDSANIYKK
ncbi:MAG: hypothetical protein JKY09_07420 [Crocinitomicaceae bacterium]|nr:hypothetical protein [Crocinitomicaceae bacterium]